jgi:hypothetical protein
MTFVLPLPGTLVRKKTALKSVCEISLKIGLKGRPVTNFTENNDMLDYERLCDHPDEELR